MFNVLASAHRYLAVLSANVCDTSYPNPAAVDLLWSDFSEPNLEFENVQHERSPKIRAKPVNYWVWLLACSISFSFTDLSTYHIHIQESAPDL